MDDTGSAAHDAADGVHRDRSITRSGIPPIDLSLHVEWGRWFLADRATRSVAPGFTLTSVEAEKLAKEMGAAP